MARPLELLTWHLGLLGLMPGWDPPLPSVRGAGLLGLILDRDPPLPSVPAAGVVKRRESSQLRPRTRSSLRFCALLWDPRAGRWGSLVSSSPVLPGGDDAPSQVHGECPLRCLQTVKCCADRSWAVRKSRAARFNAWGIRVKGIPGGSVVKNPPASAGDDERHRFHPWVRKLPCRKKWQPTPVFLPGKSHGPGEPGGLWSVGVAKSQTRLSD